MEIGVTPRRHNPVDSICRKLQTIQRRDQEVNSPFQIPKFQSSSYDSPHSGLRLNLEAILKKRGVQPEGDTDCDTSEGMLTPTASPAPGPVPRTPHVPITPANATYSITSMLGTLGTQGDRTPHSRTYRRNCSTPAVQAGDSYFNFTPRYSNQTQLEGSNTDMKSTKTSNPNLRAYNLNFSSDMSNMDSELAFPTLLVKRLSLGEGSLLPSEPKKENLAEVSLICEEDLLDTIFQACDTQGKGKVYVSHIVDFLRNTTCRTSEDCGLEELCNMLDPEQKDISIDLDTYHAIMKEWIEDCRSQEKDSKSDTHQESFIQRDSFLARRSALLNMTSGSLEAFGGEASRADLETSDLVFCVADLQFNNQKLQEEVRKMKQVAESMEDTNQKLIEENEELKAQAKVGQQLLQKEKMLKEELEEMKVSLTASEENRAQASAQKKQMGRENQSLISKIADLQEENLKVTFEAEENQKKMHDLWDHNADLQVQVNSFNVNLAEKESMIQERNKQIEELKLAVMEYSSVTELLRADKNKLEVQIQMMQPDVAIPGLSLSVAYRLNQMSSGCLQTELALAQNPLEGLESMSSSVCFASSLDETLDREVLLLLQGPTPEQLSMEFKTLISRLKKEFKHDSLSFLSAFRSLPENNESLDASTDLKMQSLEMQVEQRRSEWTHSLDQLDQYKDSLEKELLKMASNLRRSRTEILHLSRNVQELENQNQQLREELDHLKTPVDRRETSCQTLDLEQQNTPVQEIFLEISCDIEMYQHKNKMKKSIEELFGGSKGEAEATQDSGVETGELQRDLTFSLTSVTDNLTDTERQDASFEDEEGLQRPYVVKENARLPQCTRLEDAHDQAAPVPHTSSLCAGQSFEIKTPQELVSQGSFPVTNDVVSTFEVDPVATDVVEGRNLPLGTTIGGAGFEHLLDMSDFERLIEGELSKGSAKSDKSPLLPVAEEEEAMPEISTSYSSAPDKDRSVSTKISASSGSNTVASNVLQKDPADNFKDETLEPTASEGKKDPHPQRNKFKKEMSSMEAIEEHKAQEDNDESVSTEKGVACVTSEDSSKDENISLSPNDKEIEAEFHRLSLGFKCDMFTLEKRLRLEERSRDLAEENVRKEVNSCQGLLQGLIPRCEEDNQSMEIIHRLQKNLEILMQSMTRVSSRSEMLGAIHQESRVGKGVEVMIQHVENLRRMYTKEHAELLELRENLVPNEKPFGGHVERDDFRNKKPPSNMFKTTSRRISIAYIPRSGGSIPSDAPKDTAETDVERFSRRSPWNMAAKRPPLKRFISSGTWADVDEPALMNRCGYDTDSQSEEERKEEPEDRRSSLTELGIRITSFILQATTASSTDRVSTSVVEGRPAAPRPTRGVWIWLALFVVLAVLLALLASLMLQPVADAAPVGTGDSWTTIQQLLWPYTGLRHNGQPPV